jgi:hypothetical protein
MKAVWIAGLAVAVAASCSASDGGLDAPTMQSVTLGPGRILEIQFTGDRGDEVTLRVTGDGHSIMWDVHRHDGTEPVTLDQGEGLAIDTTFVVPDDDRYWFLIGNRHGQPITLDIEIELTGSAVVERWIEADAE